MDVPASVSAGSSETLGQTGAKTGGDIVSLASGVSLAAGAVEAGDVQVNIRGPNGARGAENSVAIVVDGIQRSIQAALIQNQGILKPVEVPKGTHGGLFGSTATAVAVVIKQERPGNETMGDVHRSAAHQPTH